MSVDIALHESAHAVVAVVLGARVTRVFIRDDGSGATEIEGMSPRVALRAALAGRAASVVFGREDVLDSKGDLVKAYERAVRIAADEDADGDAETFCGAAGKAAALASPDEVAGVLAARWERRSQFLVAEAEREVEQLLGRHRLVVRTLAAHLERWRYLDGKAVHAAVEEGRLRQADTYESWRAT